MKKAILPVLIFLLLLSLTSACAQEPETEYYCTLRITESFSGGYTLTRREITYDKNWRLSTDITYNADGSEYNAYSYEYNEDATIVTVTQRFNGEVRGGQFHRTYDPQGNLIKEIAVEADGTNTMTNEYTWDDRGNVLTHVYTPNGPVVITSSYTYDDHNNRTSCTQTTRYPDQDLEFTIAYRYFYDEENRLIREEACDMENAPASYTKYTYDSETGQQNAVLFNAGSTPVSSTKTTFDAAGNVLVQEQFDAQGTLLIRTCQTWLGTDGSTASGSGQE